MLKRIIVLSALMCFSCSGSEQNRATLSSDDAEKIITEALKENKAHNVINDEYVIIKDTLTPVNIAEAILLGTYGKNAIEQKPYTIHHIKNY